jgi:putative acetyltransferase
MLRQLELKDIDRAAAVHRASFDHALPALTGLHTPGEDRWFFRERIFATCQVWGSFDHQELLGIIAFREGWIDQLWVLPSSQGRGIGTALLAIAQSRFPGLSLWTFQRNKAARRFYESHCFTLVEETDGSATRRKSPTPCTVGRPAAELDDVWSGPLRPRGRWPARPLTGVELPSRQLTGRLLVIQVGHRLDSRRHSALTDCTVQIVGTLPKLPVDETATPFMNHIDVLPLVSRHSRSLIPSPL